MTMAWGLIASAAAEPHALYVRGRELRPHRFAGMEMRSDAYLAERHKAQCHPPRTALKGRVHTLAEERDCQ